MWRRKDFVTQQMNWQIQHDDQDGTENFLAFWFEPTYASYYPMYMIFKGMKEAQLTSIVVMQTERTSSLRVTHRSDVKIRVRKCFRILSWPTALMKPLWLVAPEVILADESQVVGSERLSSFCKRQWTHRWLKWYLCVFCLIFYFNFSRLRHKTNVLFQGRICIQWKT